MSLKLSRQVRLDLQDLLDHDKYSFEGRVLSLSPNSPNYAEAVKFLGKKRCDVAISHLKKFSGHSGNIYRHLKNKNITIYDPLSGEMISCSKSSIYRKYQYFFFMSGDTSAILVLMGSRPYTIFYPNEKIWIDLNNHSEDHRKMLEDCLSSIRHSSRDFFRYLSLPDPSKTALVVGDERPTHFIRESLGGLQYYIDRGDEEIFWKAVDYLVVPHDYCFILPDEIFDIPEHVKIVYIPLSNINRFMESKNVFACRMMRSGGKMNDYLRKRIINKARELSNAPNWPDVSTVLSNKNRVTVWYSVEIEKSRIQNQNEVIECLISFLNRKYGNNIQLVVDGWSQSSLNLNRKDRVIITLIRKFLRNRYGKNDIPTVEAFTMPYLDKIRIADEVDFFVTMHGSAALIPSLICHKPGITYHSQKGMTIDHEVWTPTLYRTLTRDLGKADAKSPWAPFEVDIPSLEKTLEQLVSEWNITPGKEILAPPTSRAEKTPSRAKNWRAALARALRQVGLRK